MLVTMAELVWSSGVCGIACYKRLYVYRGVSPSKLHSVTDPVLRVAVSAHWFTWPRK